MSATDEHRMINGECITCGPSATSAHLTVEEKKIAREAWGNGLYDLPRVYAVMAAGIKLGLDKASNGN